MKVSKPLAYCLSFSWASCLVDLYAAFQTEYWAMLFTTIGVRAIMTVIALSWCINRERRRQAQAAMVEQLGLPSREAVPMVTAATVAEPKDGHESVTLTCAADSETTSDSLEAEANPDDQAENFSETQPVLG